MSPPLLGGPNVRIFTIHTGETVGINKESRLQPEGEYTLRMEHGWLQPVGPAEEVEEPTPYISFIFTYEGESTGWVLASAHPGLPDPPVNREGLEEGQTFKGSDLLARGFVRSIPE